MNERTWLQGDGEHPLTDDRTVEKQLWTRRSALALTAGFFALGATTPARAGIRADAGPAGELHRGLEVQSGARAARSRRHDAQALRRSTSASIR